MKVSVKPVRLRILVRRISGIPIAVLTAFFGAMAQRNTEQEGLRLAAKPSTNYVNMNSLVKVLVTDVIVEGPVKS